MLECIALGRRYGRKTAVSDLNLMLDAGKIHVLLGENGSGKTTFLKMAAGLLRPSRGQILFQGHPLSWRDRAKISWLSTESVFYDYMRVSDVLRPGVPGGQRPFHPVRTSACGLVCLRRDLLPGPRSSLLPADRFSRGQEAESAGCLIGHIPILYMELTQTWQNPPFRFATMKKSRSGACKCFRPETHSETEGTIHGRKQRPHPSVPDPVRAAGSFFRRRLGCLHWTDAVSLKIFEIHRSGRFSAQSKPDIFRKKPPELLPFRGFQAVFLTHSSQIYCKYQSSQRWRSSPSGSPPGG